MTPKRKTAISLKSMPAKGSPKGGGSVALSLQGELTIGKAKEINTFLQKNLKDYRKFNINIDNPISIDLSIIQLLHSFSISASEQQKEVVMSFNLSSDLSNLLKNSGFDTLIQQ